MVATGMARCNLLQAVGNTPLLTLKKLNPADGATILLKAEFMNPGGSVKDRIAKYIVEKAEERGELKLGYSIILEVTSGNTGIGFSWVGAQKGYPVTIVLPTCASVERRKMIQSYGAKLELIDNLLKINDARREAEERAKKDPRIFLPRQFENPDNPKAHETTTGQEIIAQAGEDVDAFIMGVGTGGTLMGVGAALKKVNPKVQVIALEPAESAVMSGEKPGQHGIQGLADGFIPDIIDMTKIDRVVTVRTQDAIDMAVILAKEEAMFVGISSGANVYAALKIAKELGPGKKIVTVLPDRGERYLSVWK